MVALGHERSIVAFRGAHQVPAQCSHRRAAGGSGRQLRTVTTSLLTCSSLTGQRRTQQSLSLIHI
eukprot:13508014-Alexandrium_andersonii.AAC.1